MPVVCLPKPVTVPMALTNMAADRSRTNTGELRAIEATRTAEIVNRGSQLSHQVSPKPRAGGARGAVWTRPCFTERSLGRAWLSCDRKPQSPT